MPQLRESTTAVVIRGDYIQDGWTSEPYEAGWAIEAVVFVRRYGDSKKGDQGTIQVEISPDGIHWADEGTTLAIPEGDDVAIARIAHFGNWLRLHAKIAGASEIQVIGTLHLKG